MVERKDKPKNRLDLLILQDLFIVTLDKMENKTGSQAGLYQMRRECNGKGRICTHQYMLRIFRRDLKDIVEGKEWV